MRAQRRVFADGWEGQGEARQGAQAGEQQATHLAACLSARERNSSLLSVLYLNAYLHSPFVAGNLTALSVCLYLSFSSESLDTFE